MGFKKPFAIASFKHKKDYILITQEAVVFIIKEVYYDRIYEWNQD